MMAPVRRWLGALLSVAAGFAGGLSCVVVVEPMLPTVPTVVGLRLEGQQVPVGYDVRGLVEAHARAFGARRVALVHGSERHELSMGELGGYVDVPATVSRAHDVGHRGSMLQRMREVRAARRGALDVALVHRLDEEAAIRALSRHADVLHKKPKDASLDLDKHAKIPDEPGQELDVGATIAALAERFQATPAALDAAPPLDGSDPRASELELLTRPIDAEVRLADLEDIDVSKVLASYETRFAPYQTGRARNVELAASHINGLVLRPMQSLSFNDRVGPRTREAGFLEAPEIIGDELSVGIGGGTCQVSSTLHGAALHGGIAVVHRQSHSRISSYIPLGLDATVAYPEVDLKLQNPFSFTIVIHAFFPEPGLLRVELLGGDEVQSIEYRYGVSHVEDFVRRITVKRFLKPGTGFRKQRGTRGMDVHSYVTIRFKDGKVEERRYYSGYRPTPEVFWVSTDYDEANLPTLPEHATGIEGRMPVDGSDVYDSG